MPPKTTPEPTPKTVSPAILAARAYNRIEALVEQRDAELANAPESISARYKEKIDKVRGSVDDDTLELLDGMLEKSGIVQEDAAE